MRTLCLDQREVDRLFEDKTTQDDVILGLYDMISVHNVSPWPKVNQATWVDVGKKFVEFDKKHHPTVMAGGLWLNMGFSVDDSLEDWVVRFEEEIEA